MTHFGQPLRCMLILAMVIAGTTPTLYGQLQIERELIGAAAVICSVQDSDAGELLIDASFGEVVIDVPGSSIFFTEGFHQGFLPNMNRPGGTANPLINPAREELVVEAYPNPAVERLKVDLSKVPGKLASLYLVNSQGQPVKMVLVRDIQLAEFTELSELPGGMYYLQGISAEGESFGLGAISILTFSGN